MGNELKIVIPGRPIAKARPKFFRRGNFIKAYSTQKDESDYFIWNLDQQLNGHEIFKGAVEIILWFGIPRPKSHYGTGRNKGILKSSAPKYPVTKPDEDNLKKFVYDLFNGRIWEDDRQVVKSICAKEYSDKPRTEIIVRGL